MKQSIFTNPIFINPQGYLIIPELSQLSNCIPLDLESNQYTFDIKTFDKISIELLNNNILRISSYGDVGNCILGEFQIQRDLFKIDYTQLKNKITINFINQSNE